MPSISHETILSVFEDDPEALLELLRERGLLHSIPRHTRVELGKTNFRRIVPSEHRADLVLVLYDRRRPVLALVVEVQLGKDQRKYYSWPRYLAGVHDKYRCLTYLIVVTLDAEVTRWAKQGIPTFHPPFAPVVIAPKDVPLVTTPQQARRSIALSLLSVLAHASGPKGPDVVHSAVAAARSENDAEHLGLCYVVVDSVLTKSLEQAIKAKYMISIAQIVENGRNEGLKQALREGEKRGEVRGEKRGEKRGRAEAKAEAILRILANRGIKLTPAEKQRISRCRTLDTLDGWFDRALTAQSADDLFG